MRLFREERFKEITSIPQTPMPHTRDLLDTILREGFEKIVLVTEQEPNDSLRELLDLHDLSKHINKVLHQRNEPYVDEQGNNRTKTISKGEVILEYLQDFPLNERPAFILFVDDIDTNLESVQTHLAGQNHRLVTVKITDLYNHQGYDL